jgi:hypothetical protein
MLHGCYVVLRMHLPTMLYEVCEITNSLVRMVLWCYQVLGDWRQAKVREGTKVEKSKSSAVAGVMRTSRGEGVTYTPTFRRMLPRVTFSASPRGTVSKLQ